MKKLRIGIVGFGYMGKMHSMGYENLKYYYRFDEELELELYALADPFPPANIPVKFKKIYKDYQELMNDPEIDIVDVCAPNFMHKEVLVAAIKANKYIYCEKPLSVNSVDARAVIDAMKKYNYKKTNRIGFEYRFAPAVIRAKELLEEGAIGKLIQFNFKYYGSEFLDPQRPISWQSTKEKSGGGVLYALGTHAIDLIRYLVGDVDSVYAFQKTVFKQRPLKGTDKIADVEIEDILNILCNCGDVPGTLLLSQVAAGAGIDFVFELYGEKGAIKFTQENPNVLFYFNDMDAKSPHGGYGGYKAIETMQKYDGAAVFPPPRVNIAWSRYHIASIYSFISAVLENKSASPTLKDAYRVQEITDAIYKSAEEGKVIDIQRS